MNKQTLKHELKIENIIKNSDVIEINKQPVPKENYREYDDGFVAEYTLQVVWFLTE